MKNWLTLPKRCTRSCFECPCCTAPLSVANAEPTLAPTHLGVEAVPLGPYVLSCSYCAWNSKEIGIQFEKPNNIYSQLAKLKNGGERIVPPIQRRLDSEDGRRKASALLVSGEDEDPDQDKPADNALPEIRFANLKAFYQSQLADSTPISPLNYGADFGYGSPSSLSRIMGLYTTGSFSASKPKSKTKAMREARDESEGLFVLSAETDTINELHRVGWAGTVSRAQRRNQIHDPRFTKDLRPVPYLLRTKRSKRCKTCRHILTKPESKISNTRFRIRLVAMNYIPTMSIKALSPTLTPAPTTSLSQIQLQPSNPTQFLLTLKNPLFDPVKITLATPSHTPGRVSSKITILCPQFDIGANTDVWDEALADVGKDRRRKAGDPPEAGKVWERGRNWCSVVVEVVPGLLKGSGANGEEEILAEDEDVLEIPVFVRVEWESDSVAEETGAAVARERERAGKEKRELAYWCVLGVGRIADA